jgi:hypothetical protein
MYILTGIEPVSQYSYLKYIKYKVEKYKEMRVKGISTTKAVFESYRTCTTFT